MLSIGRVVLLGVIALAAINVVIKMWRAWKHQRTQPVDKDAQIDRDLNADGQGYPLTPFGWFKFILEGSPKAVVGVGIFFAVYMGIAYQQEHEFDLHSAPVQAVFMDNADSFQTAEFTTLEGKKIRTTFKYNRATGENSVQLRYFIENPSVVKISNDLYDTTKGLAMLSVLTLALGFYRMYLFRPKPPIKDWRNEI